MRIAASPRPRPLLLAVAICLSPVPALALSSQESESASQPDLPSPETAAESTAAESTAVEPAAAVSAEGTKEIPAELSVAPLDHVEYPADRPPWLSNPPSLEAAWHEWVVVTPPCDTADQAQELLSVLTRAAVASYVEQLTGSDADAINFPVSDDWIEKTLVSRRYSGRVAEGDMDRVEQAVELVFNPTVQEDIRSEWKNHQVKQRLGAVGLGVAGLLGTLICGTGVLSVISRRATAPVRDEPASADRDPR